MDDDHRSKSLARSASGPKRRVPRVTGFVAAPWPRRLRSREWFEGTSKDNIYHRCWMKNQGLPADLFDGRPVIGICNTWSELTPATPTCATSPSG